MTHLNCCAPTGKTYYSVLFLRLVIFENILEQCYLNQCPANGKWPPKQSARIITLSMYWESFSGKFNQKNTSVKPQVIGWMDWFSLENSGTYLSLSLICVLGIRRHRNKSFLCSALNTYNCFNNTRFVWFLMTSMVVCAAKLCQNKTKAGTNLS